MHQPRLRTSHLANLILPVAMPAAILFVLLSMQVSANAEEAMRIVTPDGASQSWTAARIKSDLASEISSCEYQGRDGKRTSSGVPLLALLKSAGVPVALQMDPHADPHVKNANLRLVVTIQGGDGYTVAFSLAELMPDIGGREAWLALDEDGKHLPHRDGIAKLILPADPKPGGWVRNVTTIRIVDATATTRPAAAVPGQ